MAGFFGSGHYLKLIAMDNFRFEIRKKVDGYWVGYSDENGDWWVADLVRFDTIKEAVKFCAAIQETQDD
ncbi:MAG: hypothetical protein LUO80_07495 [Methylococcaceae bacterium]|nr:hypothetical protein [Methylococcaceae bacterium]